MAELYLSRMVLDLHSRQVRRDLADCYEMHRTVMSLFGSQAAPDEADGRVLYRVETRPMGSVHPAVILQSTKPPAWTGLPDRYVLPSPENPSSKRIDHLFAQLQPNTTLRFRLLANPTRKIRVDGGGGLRPARVDLRGDERLLTWLHRKADSGGFELLEVQVRDDRASLPDVRWQPSDRTQGVRRTNSDVHWLTFAGVIFDGHLRVHDPSRFAHTLRRGIGSAKGFGFGLLSIAPASSE